jgi:hypothetical protein
VFSLVGHRLAAEQRLHDPQPVLECRLALPHRWMRHPHLRELVRHVAAAEPKDEAAAGDPIDVHGALRQDHRVRVVHAADQRPEANGARGLSERAKPAPRCVCGHDRVIREPQRVEAKALGRLDEIAGGRPVR